MKKSGLLLITSMLSVAISLPALAAYGTSTSSTLSSGQNSTKTKQANSTDSIKSIPVEKRSEAEGSAKSLLDKFDDRMNQFSKKVKDKKDEAMKKMHEEREEVGKLYDELKKSSKEHWESVKKRFVKAYDELEQKFENKEQEEKENPDGVKY